MDCFDLAWDARELDMRAAPYDIRDWGYEPIPVETTEGKAEYVRIQRELSERSIELRERLLRLEGWKIALAHPQQALTQLN